MTDFQRVYQQAQKDGWKHHYVDYGAAKQLLKGYRRQRLRDFSGNANAQHRLHMEERQDFANFIEGELRKATALYKQQLHELRSWAPHLSAEGLRPTNQQLKQQILDLYGFCAVNILTIRQLLLKYDALIFTFEGLKLTEWDLERQERLKNTFFSMKALNDVYAVLSAVADIDGDDRDSSTSDLKAQIVDLCKILDATLKRCQNVAGGHMLYQDRMVNTMRQYLAAGMQRSGLLLEPEILRARGQSLRTDMRRLVRWLQVNDELNISWNSRESATPMDPVNVWPLFLNLVSCFLFMMNNYIIEPSSAYYANALGSSDALSGIMVGAAPWFALLSSIMYSMWTNRSYKQPMVFATFLMVIGNTLYASAYSFKSMELCLLGRAISGVGAPRIINRRYVADATPFSLRTMASAAFALMTALGSAMGPGMAIILDSIKPFEFSLPLLGRQHFNGMTGPGYFMAMCWAVFFFLVVATFVEPNRTGLEELKQREEKNTTEPSIRKGRTTFGRSDTFHDELEEEMLKYEHDDDEEDGDEEFVSENSPMYCIKHMTKATALCMLLIFMKRIALECIVGSTSIVTKNRYHWGIKNVGTLHLINGLIVIPVSILAGFLSQYYEDRFLASCFITVTFFGMLVMVDSSDLVDSETSDTYNYDSLFAVGHVRYIAGSLIAFSGVEACESFVASLMSKVVPSALAVGTFNSGLLATLVGTSGRAVGDLFITMMGLISIRNLLDLLILPGLGLMLVSLILIRRNYYILEV